MHLYARLVPPLATREALAAAVEAAQHSADDAPARPRGWRRLLGGRGKAAPPASSPTLVATDVADLGALVSGFGNLSRPDAHALMEALGEAAAEWARPTLRVQGGVALEWPGDDGVWAALAGDTAGLELVARSTNRVAQNLNLYVDRRRFRPYLNVGTVNDATTAEVLERVLAALSSFDDPEWPLTAITISELTGRPTGARYETFAEVPLPA